MTGYKHDASYTMETQMERKCSWDGGECDSSYVESKPTIAKGVSTIGAIGNVLATAVGVGMLALPNSIAKSGYIAGFTMFWLCLAMSVLCCWMLKRAMCYATALNEQSAAATKENDTPITLVQCYEDIGLVAYGKPGSVVVSVALHSALIGCGCLIALLMGESMHRLFLPFCSMPEWSWVIICCFVMLPFVCLRTMEQLAKVTSTLGFGSIAALTLAMIAASIMYICRSDELSTGGASWLSNSPVREYSISPSSFWSIGGAFGCLVFSFAVTCTLPTILHDMQQKKDANKVIGYGLALTGTIYFALAVFGYIAFGSLLIEKKVTDFISVLEPNHWITICIDSLLLVVCVTHYAVMLNPSCRALERWVMTDLITRWSLRRTNFESKPRHIFHSTHDTLIIGTAIRTGLVIVTALVAIFCGKFSALVDLIGSVSFTLVHMVFPPIFYLKLRTMMGYTIFQTPGEKAITVLCVLVLLVAAAGAVVGTMSSIKQFVGF